MPESTLALSYDDIRKRVARERGYGTAIEDWTDQEKELVEFCVRDGSAVFYTQSGHEWSFLEPLATVTLEDGETEVELPWDFSFPIDNEIYFADNVGRCLSIVDDAVILKKRQDENNTTGRPILCAIVVTGKPGGLTGQKAKMIFWPEADDDYSIRFRYAVLPDALSASRPVPYGGAAHAQTLLEACLAASEKLDGTPGPHTQLYQTALEASKIHDRRLKPRNLGYNGDRTNRRTRPWNSDPVVTYVPTL